MDKVAGTNQGRKKNIKSDWTTIATQLGLALAQGAAFALGGAAMTRLTGPSFDTVATNDHLKLLPMKKVQG